MSDRTPPLTIVSALLLLVGAALSGCNTVRGVGQDVEATGDTISDVAAEAEDELDAEGD